MKTGFTLIELLIALVLFDVGLLALVALAASISRNGDDSRFEANAWNVAAARLERIASTACGAAASGIARTNAGLIERFSDMPAPNGTRLIVDSVTYTTTRGARIVALQTGAWC